MMGYPHLGELPRSSFECRGTALSKAYFGREQTRAKHDILRRYLKPFAYKVLSYWDSLDFVDGFSGPWENNDTVNLSDTSIGISLQALSEIAEGKGHTKDDPKIRCVFNEEDKRAFERLEEFASRAEEQFPLLKIEIFRGRFEDNASLIRQAADHKFQLLFIDPTGYTGFPPSTLALFNGRQSEIIVNFMASFIRRFVCGDHEDRAIRLAGLVGEERASQMLKNDFTVDDVQAEYLRMLKEDLSYRYAAFSPIHNPDKNEIHFNLVYGTNHFEGMETMRQAEYAALSAHDRTRFEKHDNAKGDDLFSRLSEPLEIEGPYLRERRAHTRRASDELVSILEASRRPVDFKNLAAVAQQNLFLKRAEIGDALCHLAKQGRVEAVWREQNRRKPKPGDQIKLT